MKTLVLLSVLSILAAPAHAALVRYEFTARVNDMFEYDGVTRAITNVSSSAFSGSLFQLSDQWTGSFVYSDEMTLNDGYQPTQPTTGSYLVYRGEMGVAIANAASGFAVASDPELSWLSLMQIRNALPGTDSDIFHFTAYRSGNDFESAGISLFDHTGMALDSPVPPPRLNLTDFYYRSVSYVFLRRSDGSQMHASAEITSLNRVELPQEPVGMVPEPGSLALVGLGAAAMLARRGTRSLRAGARMTSTFTLLRADPKEIEPV